MPFVVLDFFLSLVLLLPISDSRKQQRFPIVTLILVGINTGIFIYIARTYCRCRWASRAPICGSGIKC